jgi:hypothetical protein
VLEDFVVPVMYLRDMRTLVAWGVAWREIISGNVGSVVLFYLMKIALGLAVAIIAVIATCVTCCIAALPYIGTVILLPLFVFGRCYTLYFIEGRGEGWRFIADEPPPSVYLA